MTSILTAVALVAHVLGGCCWHHEHSCREPSTGITLTTMVQVVTHACECPHHPEAEEPAAPIHDKGQCDEGRCVTAFRDSGSERCSQDSLPVMVTEVNPTLGRIESCGVAAPAQHGFTLPLRIHLLHQIMLI